MQILFCHGKLKLKPVFEIKHFLFQLIIDFIDKNADKCFEIQVTKPIIAPMTFFMPSVNSSKVNLYGNKLE